MKRILVAAAVVIAAAAALAVGWGALHWAPDRPVEALVPRWGASPSRFVDLGALRVHVRDEGPRADPLPIVLVHGTSASLHTWEGWAGALRGERRVISMDLPGFGLTGPAPERDYSIAAYVRFLAALLDALEVRRCVLAGNSLGGEIAWQFALAYPDRVARLVLVDAAGYPVGERSVPLAWRLAAIPGLGWVTTHVLPRGLVQAGLEGVYGDPGRVGPELVDRYYELSLRAGNRAALQDRLRYLGAGADATRIASVRTPTLIVWGGADRVIPPAHAGRFAHDIAGSRQVVLDGLGHVPHEEDPSRSLAAVRDFLDAP